MKFDAKLIRTAALGFLAGAVIAGAAVFFTVSHLFRERSRETFELYNATLASARLAALQVLRDEGFESGIALLENALLNDLKALELDEVREATSRMMIDRIKAYQKEHPPAVFGDEESALDSGAAPEGMPPARQPRRTTEADRARR